MASKKEKPINVSPEHHEHLKKVGFQKGKSGNPAGRPPIPQEIKDALAAHSLEAVAMRYWLMHNSKNDMVRLKAAEGFTEPFVSKAVREQKIDMNVSVDFGDFLARVNSDRNSITAQAEAPLLIDGELVDEVKKL